MKKTIISLLAFFFVFVSGCVALQEHRVGVTPKPSVTPAPLFPEGLLDDKIDFLNKTLENKELTEKDRKIALSLLDIYRSVKNIPAEGFGEVEYQNVVRSLLDNLNAMDEIYFSKQAERAKYYSRAISLFAAKRKEIQEAFVIGDSKGVINHCLELKAVLGPDALTAEISLMFALSLAKAGMMTEAKSIIEGITPELDMGPDLNTLKASIAELHLQLGEREKAVQAYKKLSETFHKQDVILQTLSKKIWRVPIKEPETNAPEPSQTVLETRPQTQDDDEQTIHPDVDADQILDDVNQLIKEHKFGEAWNLLVLKREAISSEKGLKIIDQALKRLERAQEDYLEETISMISEKKQAIQMARKLIDEEKYEQAIASLDTLSEREESHEVKALREQAVESLINRERNRAAQIFLTARRTSDPEKKEQYLRSSYEILKNLIEEYPSSYLINKVKSNLKTVEEELEKL